MRSWLTGVADEQPDRATVHVVELGRDDLQALFADQALDHRQRVVLQVLVHDRVEGVGLQHHRQVVQLHHPDAPLGQASATSATNARGYSRS